MAETVEKVARPPKRPHGRLRQAMGAKKKRQQRITREVDRLAIEYAQGRAAASCWNELMKAANEG